MAVNHVAALGLEEVVVEEEFVDSPRRRRKLRRRMMARLMRRSSTKAITKKASSWALSDSSTTNNVNIVSKEEWPQSMAADASFSVDSVEDQQHALLKEHTTSPMLPTLNSKELSALDLSPPPPPSSKAPLITATHALVKAPSSTLASNHDDNSIHDDSITSVSSFNSSSRSDIGIGSGTSLLHHAATLDDENFDKHFIFEKNHDPLDDAAAAAADGSEKLLHERQQDEQQNDPCPSCSMYHAGDLNDVTLLPLVLILCVVALLLVLKKKTMLLQQEEADKSQSHDCYERTVGDYYSGDSSDTSSLTSFSSLSCSSVSAEMETISTSDVALLQLSKPTPPAATKTRRAAARRRYAHAGVHHHPSLSQSQRPCRDKPIIIMLDEDAKDSIEDCDYDNDGYNHIKVF